MTTTADPIQGMARALAAARAEEPAEGLPPQWVENEMPLARAAWAYALARLREPSEARTLVRLEAWRDTRPYRRTSHWLAAVIKADLHAFAREHGLEPPGAQR